MEVNWKPYSCDKRVFFLGITGGIACGKSLVYNYFTKLGVDGISADNICRSLTQKDTPTLHKIKNTFGKKFILDNGELDRVGLGELIFSDPVERERLNSIIHPKVERSILRWANGVRLASTARLAVLEIPLLFETGSYSWLDGVLVVCTDRESCLTRMKKRDGIPEEECAKRYDAQLALEKKKKLANWVIYNNTTKEAAQASVIKIYDDIIKI